MKEFLNLIPNSLSKFYPMERWKIIKFDSKDKEAIKIFENKDNFPNHPKITEKQNPIYIISYLRYDLKKILIRLRKVYVDNKIHNGILSSPITELPYFESLLLCLCFSETLGRFKYNTKKHDPLLKVLENDLKGYAKNAKILDKYFRNGLAHTLRPYCGFHLNFNTKTLYKPPHIFKIKGQSVLRINIIHFIDSLVIGLENYITELKRMNSANLVSP